MLLCLLLSLLVTVLSRSLFYKTGTAGLFSQFIQVKLMHEYARKFNRTLVVDAIKCSHYKLPVLMTDLFDFDGYNIASQTAFPSMECHKSIKEVHVRMGTDENSLCYAGPFPTELTGENVTRYGILESLGLDPPLKLKRLNGLNDFMNSIGIDSSRSFTVAHWRRGDQTTRCRSGMDRSVNCGTGDEFVSKIRQFTNDSVVYVATNERQQTSMLPIRKAMFKTMNAHDLRHLDELTTLALEVELMLRATTFLAWGLSEIDDVVEYERMKAGKTHCVAYEHYVAGRNLTFCNMLKEFHRVPSPTMKFVF